MVTIEKIIVQGIILLIDRLTAYSCLLGTDYSNTEVLDFTTIRYTIFCLTVI